MMGSVRTRLETGTLFVDFKCYGVRCREQTALEATAGNRRKLGAVLKQIEAEIVLGTFDYARYFPDSPRASFFEGMSRPGAALTFEEFSSRWLGQTEEQWKPSHRQTVRSILSQHVNAHFGSVRIDEIDRKGILDFRAKLVAQVSDRTGHRLSASRVNHIVCVLRNVLEEAEEQLEVPSAYRNIKQLPVRKTDIQPFSLTEIGELLAAAPRAYRDYLLIRFFTGLRTGEIDGLEWRFVNFDRSEIFVRQSLVRGQMVDVKTVYSLREVAMSAPVVEAFERLAESGSKGRTFVFTSGRGSPLDQNNFRNRVWYPLLEKAGMERRNPYQTRHTAATLFLASGENPEWIARQLGHGSTEMLFRTYSRYVPNLTRQDGSAFNQLLQSKLEITNE